MPVKKRAEVVSPWISKSDAAVYIHRDPSYVDQLIVDGVLTPCPSDARRGRNGSRAVYVNTAELDEYMYSRRISPAEYAREFAPALLDAAGRKRVSKRPREGAAMTPEEAREAARAAVKHAKAREMARREERKRRLLEEGGGAS